MQQDLWFLYKQMLLSRVFEQEVAKLWDAGHISGEMHLGVGEEGIAAGVTAHLQQDDAMALDHRGTPPLLMRGADPAALLKEFLGLPDGLCSGQGGHMHLFAPDLLAASSGIVGAVGPAAAGFALAAQHLRKGSMAVGFFGEGAVNQGMLLESLNLAAAWNLPVLFVCKDNEWAITTHSPAVTAGGLAERARGFGMALCDVDGTDAEDVQQNVAAPVERARRGEGPTFVHARCVHLQGHFLGDALLRTALHPLREMTQTAGPLLKSLLQRKGAEWSSRAQSLGEIRSTLKAAKVQISDTDDPVEKARRKLRLSNPDRLTGLEREIHGRIERLTAAALESIKDRNA